MSSQASLTDGQPSSPPAVSSTTDVQQLPSTSNKLNSSTDSDSAIASAADLPSSTTTGLNCLFPICRSNVRIPGKRNSREYCLLVHLHRFHGIVTPYLSFKANEPERVDWWQDSQMTIPKDAMNVTEACKNLRNRIQQEIVQLPFYNETQESDELKTFLADRRKTSHKSSVTEKFRHLKLQVAVDAYLNIRNFPYSGSFTDNHTIRLLNEYGLNHPETAHLRPMISNLARVCSVHSDPAKPTRKYIYSSVYAYADFAANPTNLVEFLACVNNVGKEDRYSNRNGTRAEKHALKQMNGLVHFYVVNQLSPMGAESIEFSTIRTIGISNLKSNERQGTWTIPAGLTMEEVVNAGAIICYLAFEAYRVIKRPNEQVETPGLDLFKVGLQEAENLKREASTEDASTEEPVQQKERKREAPTEPVQQEQRPSKRIKTMTDYFKRVPKSSSSDN